MTKKYTKTFDFGKVAYNGKNKKNAVCLDITLKIKDNKPVFSASGEVWNSRHSDIEMGGQCIDDIYNEFKGEIENRKQFESIMGLWERNHLNDMNAGCEHQRALKWGDKTVSISKLKLKWSITSKQREIEKRNEKNIKNKRVAKVTIPEQNLLKLEYWITVPTEDVSKYPEYEVESTEETSTNWLNESEHSDGVLNKPCPTCGYKYGSAWVYKPITKKDLIELFSLLPVPMSEYTNILKMGV